MTKDEASCIVVREFIVCCTPQVSSARSMGSPCASYDRLVSRLSLAFVDTST